MIKQRENPEFITIDIDEWEFIINYSYRVEEGYKKIIAETNRKGEVRDRNE
jgi:hypothetical protein